jgi:TP901 family phage tail tape measure protein
MAEAIINYSSLINDDGGFLKLEKDFENLGKNLVAQTKQWQQSLSVVDVRDTNKISEYEKEITKLKNSYKKLSDQQEKLKQVKKKAIELSKQELIAQQQERAEMAKNRAEAKAISQVKSSQAGSIEQLRAKLSLVTIAWSKLSEEERNNSDRGKRLVESKKSITEQLKREELATGDARRNVGNYAETVKKAIAEMRIEEQQLKEVNKELKYQQSLLPKNSAEYKLYQQEINKTDKQLSQLNDSLGNGGSKVEGFGNTLSKGRNLLMQFGIGFGVFETVRAGISTISDFETSVADLSAVTGQTGNDLKFLEDKAIEFSKKYGESASSVAEAFKLAGSARPELLKNGDALSQLTEKAIILSKASGDDVPTSIANLTATLNAFDLPASKASEVMDTLANASQLGSQEIPYLTEAFSKFGGVASQAGVGVAESASAIELLGKKIPDASTAGNQMKNILIKLQLEASKQGRTFEGFGKELERMKPKLKDITYLTKIFGSENLQGAQLLISQTEELNKFSNALGQSGTAQDQANTKSKTLSEAYNRLKSNVEAMFLKFRSGTSGLSVALDFISRNLETIISVVGKAVMAFITFKTVMKAMALVDMVKLNGGLKASISGMFDFSKSTKDATNSMNDAGKSASGFSNALKGIGLTIFIALLAEVVKGLYDIASGAESARLQMEALDRENKKGTKYGSEYNQMLTDALDKEMKLLEVRKASGKINEKQFLKEKNALLDKANQKLEFQIKLAREDQKRAKEQLNEVNKRVAKNGRGVFDSEDIAMQRILKAEISGLSNEISQYKEKQRELNNETHNVSVSTLEMTTENKKATKSVKENTTELNINNNTLDTRLGLLEEEAKIQAEINKLRNEATLQEISKKIKTEQETQGKNASQYGTVDLTTLNSLLKQEEDLKKKMLMQETEFKINEVNSALKNEFDIKMKAIEDERTKLLQQKNLTKSEEIKIQQSYNEKIAELNQEILAKEDVAVKQRELILSEFKIKNDEIEQSRVDASTTANKEILDQQQVFMDEVVKQEKMQVDEQITNVSDAIDKQNKIIEKKSIFAKQTELKALKYLQKQKYDLQVRSIEDYYDYELSKLEEGSIQYINLEKEKNNALMNLKKEYQTEAESVDKQIADNQKALWNELISTFRKGLDALLNKLEENAQKQVEVSKEKIDSQNKQVDIQRARAEQGLTNSLAFEQKELARAEAQKVKAEKRLANIQEIKALYSSYSGYASSGDKNALGHALKDYAVLKAISASIMSFGEGGVIEDRLPSNGIFRGQSHKGNNGGIPIMVEGQEGIFSVNEMKNLGKNNFYALKELAGKGKISGNMFSGQREAFIQTIPVQEQGIRKEIVEMRKSIENMPKERFDIVGYTKDMFKIIEETKTGSKTIRNVHFIKRPKL